MLNNQKNIEPATLPLTEDIVEDEMTVEGLLQSLINGATLADVMGITMKQREAIYAMGYFHYTQGKFEESLKFFHFLLFHDQWEVRAMFGVGCCLQMLGKYEAAQTYLGLAVMMEPSNPASGVQFAECLLFAEKKPEAINILNKLREEFGNIPQHEQLMRKVQALLQLATASSAAESTTGSK